MICEICGKRQATDVHHLVFGYGLRNLADEDSLVIHSCSDCHTSAFKVADRIHDNPAAEKLSKMLGQALYERNMAAKGVPIEIARENFRSRYGKSFL